MNWPSSATAARRSFSGFSRAGMDAWVVLLASRRMVRCRAHRIAIATRMITMIRNGLMIST